MHKAQRGQKLSVVRKVLTTTPSCEPTKGSESI